MILEAGNEGAEQRSGEDESPGGCLREEKKSERCEGEEDVCERVKGRGGQGADECSEENSDDAGVDAAEG